MMESAHTLVLVFDRVHHLMTSSPASASAQGPLILAAQQAAFAQGKALGLRADPPGDAASSESVSLRLTLCEGIPDSGLITSTHPLLPEEQAILDAALKAIPTWLRYGYEEVTAPKGATGYQHQPSRGPARPTLPTSTASLP